LRRLAKDLVERFGRGFGLSNLKQMRKFYLAYEARGKGQTLSGLLGEPPDISHSRLSIAQTLSVQFPLSWSHYNRLLVLNDPHKRDFYEEEASRAGWSVRQLDRQVNAMLYERVALSRKKGDLLRAAERSGPGATPEEAIKDPYVLEFLNLLEPHSEKDLESALIQHLADFLLELGYGFTFVARQKRLQVGSASYYVDLLLYHRRLRCLVAIDLKVGELTHADAGQMNLYLNYLREHEMLDGEAPPIGLILCAEKDDAVAHYALGGLTNQVFASRYQLELPDPALLKREIVMERRRLEQR
jgi:predicted nuclease of restriction endonuclease-like (RecB) superfamily